MTTQSHSSRDEIAAYRAHPLAHYSALSRFEAAGTPGKYRWDADHPDPPSAAQIIGGAVDCLLFIPEWYDEDYICPPISPDDMPDWMVLAPGGQSKGAKLTRQEITDAGQVPTKEEDFDLAGLKMNTAAGRAWKKRVSRMVLSYEDDHNIRGCVDAIKHHPLAAQILEVGRYQVPLYGERCKALPDILAIDLTGPDLIGELKTCADASPERVQWSIEEYRYHWQAALYLDVAREAGHDIEEWIWIFAEPKPPFRVEVSTPAPRDLIDLGRKQYRATLEKYLECKASDNWPISTYTALGYDLPGRAYR